jgi:hypothetical protein
LLTFTCRHLVVWHSLSQRPILPPITRLIHLPTAAPHLPFFFLQIFEIADGAIQILADQLQVGDSSVSC